MKLRDYRDGALAAPLAAVPGAQLLPPVGLAVTKGSARVATDLREARRRGRGHFRESSPSSMGHCGWEVEA